MIFNLRIATQKDEARIKQLVRTERLNPFGLKWQRFVVSVNIHDEIIGCAQLKIHWDGSNELASLVVIPEMRGLGVAQCLIDHIKKSTQKSLFLTCRSGLGNFYARHGFKVVVGNRNLPIYFRVIQSVFGLLEWFFRRKILLVMVCDAMSSVPINEDKNG